MKQSESARAVLELLAEIERPFSPAYDDVGNYQHYRRILELAAALRAAHAEDEIASWTDVA